MPIYAAPSQVLDSCSSCRRGEARDFMLVMCTLEILYMHINSWDISKCINIMHIFRDAKSHHAFVHFERLSIEILHVYISRYMYFERLSIEILHVYISRYISWYYMHVTRYIHIHLEYHSRILCMYLKSRNIYIVFIYI